MASTRIPGGAWTWRDTLLVLAVVLLTVLALGLFTQHEDLLQAIARFTGLIVSAAALVSAMTCYAAWRINLRPGLAWVTMGVVLFGSLGLIRSAVQLLRFPEPVPGLWMLAPDLISALAVVIAVMTARKVRRRPDPAATGFTVAAAAAALQLAWLAHAPDLGHQLPRLLVCAIYAAAFAAGAGILLWGSELTPRIRSIPRWARARGTLAVLLIGGADLTLYLGDSVLTHITCIVGNTAGAVLLVSTCLALLIREVNTADRSRSNLNDELVLTWRRIRAHRSQLHEINSTIAGITSASQLLRSTSGVSEQRRGLLEDMISAELGRLERLLAPTDGSGPRVTDLDRTIGTLVVAQEARGNQIHWSPSGLHVNAQPDAVAEVVNVLLDNATKHGRSSVQVTVRQTGDFIEVAVQDDGPGIAEQFRGQLFDWGARGPQSTGQGIGLHIAHQLAERQGGYLELRDSSVGATFVLGLPLDRAAQPESQDGDDAFESELT